MSLCGPSTAPQTLSKHINTDRTLQQDRLRNLPSSSQSFRSTPSHSGPTPLDLEFAQFSGLPPTLHHAPPPPQHQHQHILHHSPSFNLPPLTQHQKPTSSLSSWAADFQALSLHTTKSSPALNRGYQQSAPSFQQRTSAVPRQSPSANVATKGWGADFLSNYSGNGMGLYGGMDMGMGMEMGMGMMNGGGMYGQQSYYTPSTGGYGVESTATVTSAKGKEKAMEEDAAFDAAFDAAMLDAASQQDALDAVLEPEVKEEVHMPAVDTHTILNEPSAEESPEPSEKACPSDDGEALARTAGELLSSVREDQSEKFRGSKFLALMRQLRDKEVKVEGDKVVPVASGAGDEGQVEWTAGERGRSV